MKIAIASGKGGTGKTTVTVNLAAWLKTQGRDVGVVDCDVEEPNSHFFLEPKWEKETTEYLPVPQIDEQKCLGESCRICIQECRFKALIWMVNSVLTFPELCHGCGLCSLVCPAKAISETTREIGQSRQGKARGIDFCGGLMRIGEAMAPPLINAVKDKAAKSDIQLLDCPPGTSCPVIASMQGADFVVLVTEPTPFGLNDLKLAVDLVRKLKYPFGVVINRAGMGDSKVEQYLEQENISLLASLPHSREAATLYSKGQLLVEALPEIEQEYHKLWDKILSFQGAGS